MVLNKIPTFGEVKDWANSNFNYSERGIFTVDYVSDFTAHGDITHTNTGVVEYDIALQDGETIGESVVSFNNPQFVNEWAFLETRTNTPGDSSVSIDVVQKSQETAVIEDGNNSVGGLSAQFNPDGTKFYTTHDSNSTIYEYPLSTPYDLSSAGSPTEKNVGGTMTYGNGINISPSGEMALIGDRGQEQIYFFELTTPWDISTLSYVNEINAGSWESHRPVNPKWGPNGDSFFIVGTSDENIIKVSLSISYTYSSETLESITSYPGVQDISFQNNGSTLWVSTINELIEYELSTAWDPATQTEVNRVPIPGPVEYVRGMTWGPNGDTLIFGDGVYEIIHQFSTSNYSLTETLSSGHDDGIVDLNIDKSKNPSIKFNLEKNTATDSPTVEFVGRKYHE